MPLGWEGRFFYLGHFRGTAFEQSETGVMRDLRPHGEVAIRWEDRNGLANLTAAAAASVVESHFLGVGGREGIALGDRQGGREDVRFASSL